MSDSNSTVEYREVQGRSFYRVGSDGTVWSCRVIGSRTRKGEWRKLKPKSCSKQGHLYVYLGSKCCKLVHHLVLEAFVGPRPPDMECRHFPDRNPSNNRLENLQWGTRRENVADAIRDGTFHLGTDNHWPKLTEDQVRQMRTDYDNGGALTPLGKKYKVDRTCVWMIVTRRAWKHVP